MLFSKIAFPTALLASTAFAHSWLECVKTTNIQKTQAALNDVTAPLNQDCEGYPRNKVNNGDWIAESTHYLWDLNQHGGAINAPACHTGQRQPGQLAGKGNKMAKVKPGETIKLRYWGNGHSRFNQGSPLNRDPGLVRVYWAGKKEVEIKSAGELTDNRIIAEGNFSSPDAVILTDPKDRMRLHEKGNYLDLKMPGNIETGRHMMVWTWAWIKEGNKFVNQYTTCFDVEVTNGGSGGELKPANAPANAPKSGGDNKPAASSGGGNNGGEKCLRGGMASNVCTSNCPPCKYGRGTEIHCYEKVGGKCPFPGNL